MFNNILSKIIFALFILLSCVNPHIYSADNGKTKVPYKLSKSEKKDGYINLFNGKSLENFINNSDEYYVEDGCIVKKPKGYGNLYSKEEYCNFILRFEFQLTPGANNGLGLRHEVMPANKGYLGMELQIIDNDDPQYKDLKPYQYHGGLYNYVAAERGFLKPVGQWNSQEVIADGKNIKVILNNHVILDTNLDDATKDIPAEKIQKGLMTPCGHIAFLGHESTIRIRYIRIKKLE
ncbi:MAG: DUF1080 domain-containing protein [Bacteroidales bacterium]|nr:DUF1080 domain-containing protein [Bacteroidales bacterium]